jgi:MFS family permease
VTQISIAQPTEIDIERKWLTLILLAAAVLLAMAVNFSASAVVPALTEAWDLDASGRAWLTMSVQIGFVVGTFGSALLNLPDRIPTRWLFTVSALLAGLATALIPLISTEIASALILRFITGMFLAGVYPVGMKIMATWTKADRGLGIGLLVGALTLGSASPHLINFFGGIGGAWQPVLYGSAASALIGGLLAALFIREGPYRSPAPRFNWKYAGEILRDRDVVLANLGYLGHMWELYAMWAWISIFLLASFTERGIAPQWASLAGFAVIGVGGVSSILAGRMADRIGRTTITIAAMLVSGACAAVIGLLYGAHPALVVGLCLVWGFAVIADSAQFSACISELADPKYIGTALTLQTSMGFLLTIVTIRAIPVVVEVVTWRWAFALLTIGPLIGALSMWLLRRSPGSVRLAGGNK